MQYVFDELYEYDAGKRTKRSTERNHGSGDYDQPN
jgi:hypothetical protein